MSLPRKMTVNCSKCGNPLTATVFESVNSDYAEDIAVQIMSGELFNVECPHCKHVSHLEYDILYHDIRHGAMIWVIHKGPEYTSKISEVRATKTLPYKALRIVEDINALKEKVSCLEHGRDDRVIELCKVFVLANLLSQKSDFDFRNAFYSIITGKEIIHFYDNNGNSQCWEVNEETYTYIRDLYLNSEYAALFNKNYAIVDYKWAEDILIPLMKQEASKIESRNSKTISTTTTLPHKKELDKTCPKCGSTLPADSDFCQYCGAKLVNTASTPKPIKTAAPVSKVETPQPTKTNQQSVASNSEIAKKNPNQRYCKHCGHAIDSSTKKCTGCGKQYFRAKFRWIYIVLLIASLLVGYVGVNYSNAISAMNGQRFIESQQYFDNLFVSEAVFADKYEYVEAGVLMEEGKYVEALVAFNKIDGLPVPSTLIDSLKAKIYSAGQTAYRAEKLAEAKKYFNALTGYKRSADYLTLILCSEDSFSNWLGGEENYNKLIKLLDFENADEIMLKYESTALEFLKGRWEDGSKNDPYYFEMEKTSSGDFSDSWSSGYNLPYKDADGYFYFANGIYSVGETESSAVKIYKFSIINEDTISVYCYKDGSTHKLYRQ